MMKFSVKFDLSLTPGQIDQVLRIVRGLISVFVMSLPGLCAVW
jgi:hypothetical protein